MGVIKEKTLTESDGKDQLDRDVSAPKVGERVVVHYKGRYKKEGNKEKEFEDTYHSGKRLEFTLGKNQVIQGMDEAVRQLILGEEARFQVSSDCAYGSQSHQGFVATVPPNADIVLDVALMRIVRNGVIHCRKQPKDASCSCCHFMYNIVRSY